MLFGLPYLPLPLCGGAEELISYNLTFHILLSDRLMLYNFRRFRPKSVNETDLCQAPPQQRAVSTENPMASRWDPGGFSTTCWLMAHKNINYVLQMAVPDTYGTESTGAWVSFPSSSTHLCHVHAAMDYSFGFALIFHPVKVLASKLFSQWLHGSLVD